MKKTFYIIAFMILSYNSRSQVNHLIGIEGGYAFFFPGSVNYKLETNINYIFNYKLFCFKTEFGIIPSTNFGNIYRTFFLAGITTNIEKTISFHFLLGGGGYKFSRTTYTIPSSNITVYHNNSGYPILNAGFFIRPLKEKKVSFGIDYHLTTINIKQINVTDYNYNIPNTIGMSLNYIFSSKE